MLMGVAQRISYFCDSTRTNLKIGLGSIYKTANVQLSVAARAATAAGGC